MDNQKKMTITLFKVKGMDCPSEENIIRMKLAELGDDIASLDFDLRKRTLMQWRAWTWVPKKSRQGMPMLPSERPTTRRNAVSCTVCCS